MFGYKNMYYVAICLVVLSGAYYLGFFMKEDFENRKKELTELKGFENLKILNEKSDNEFKPTKTSELKTQCNSNDVKSCVSF